MSPLGRGGFAEVYLAEHIHLRYLVAIKFLHADLGKLESQFSDEARLVAQLQHPHIIRLMDFGIGTSPYLIMEYAAGGTLRGMYPRGVRVAPALVARYVEQIASALQYVHDLRFIHRDIKPDNILLRADGNVALSDFGIAAVMRTMHTHASRGFEGTLSCSAPEQISDKPSPASDQYSLGVVVYELLSGQLPFQGPEGLALMYQHLSVQPRPLRELVQDIPPDGEAIVMRALAKDPKDRFARISDFAASLSQTIEVTRTSERRVWPYPDIATTATSFGNRETAMLTPYLPEPTVASAASSQVVEEVRPTTVQSSQQMQGQESVGSRVLGVIVSILGILTFYAGLPLGIYVIYFIGNYLDMVEGSQMQSSGLPRDNSIVLLHVIVGFVFAIVYTVVMRGGHFDDSGETNGFRATAYTLCGSTAAAEATALALMLIYPALGGTPPTPLDWKIFGITFVVFIIEAIWAVLTYYFSHRSRDT